jgi:hypothetical protein
MTAAGTDRALRVTYLGWQSWLVQGREANVLVDPLLFDDIGRGRPAARQRGLFHPPRSFNPAALPPIDAVFITHEHEDHFDVRSLMALSPAIPVHLSALSSTAARALLADLQRPWQLWWPGRPVQVGDLEVVAFAPDHLNNDHGDEWDTLGHLIRQRDGGGAFFSNVDVALSEEMYGALAGEQAPPLIFDAMSLLRWSGEAIAEPTPEAGGEFCRDGEEARALLEQGGRLRPLPGQTIVLRSGAVAQVESGRPFLHCPPADQWPERPPFWPEPQQMRPICPGPLSPQDEGELERELGDLARFLYGRDLFRRLYSLSTPGDLEREPALALVTRRQHGPEVTFVYRPSNGAFTRVDADEPTARASFLVGMVCWASDLLALCRGELEPRAIAPGYTDWCDPVLGPRQLHIEVLSPYFHPLRRPDLCLARYRQLVQEERGSSSVLVGGPVHPR